jgi:hypothetical protein
MAVNYVTGSGPISLAMIDVNGDARPDLTTANFTGNNASVLLGNANGTFQAAANYSAGSAAFCVAYDDLNGDGRPDLVVVNSGSSNVSVLLNTSPYVGINQQPVSQSVAAGQNAIFSVAASNSGALAYQWRRDGISLVNSNHYSGVTTSDLMISGVSPAEVGVYDVRIFGGCNSGLLSQPAALFLSTACRGDFNNDSQFNGQDIPGIVAALLAGESCP